MNLQQSDLDQIVNQIKPQLTLWMTEQRSDTSPHLYEMELRERTIRVEEELSHQRELMQQGFREMDRRFEMTEKRFEQIDKRFEKMDKSFEKMDERFEQQRKDINQRFEKMDERFEQQREDINQRFEQVDKRFEQQREDINQRFEQQREDINQRFEQQREDINQRFDKIDAKFEGIYQRIERFMVWSFGFTLTIAGLVIAILRFWP